MRCGPADINPGIRQTWIESHTQRHSTSLRLCNLVREIGVGIFVDDPPQSHVVALAFTAIASALTAGWSVLVAFYFAGSTCPTATVCLVMPAQGVGHGDGIELELGDGPRRGGQMEKEKTSEQEIRQPGLLMCEAAKTAGRVGVGSVGDCLP